MSQYMKGSGVLPRLLGAILLSGAVLLASSPAWAQSGALPSIVSPTDGQVVLGQVPIKAVTDIPGFASAELAFAYDPNSTDSWFIIQTASVPATGDVIATWDTTAISDGDYMLRLRVTLADGSFRDAVASVQVRNYTPVITPSPVVTATATPALVIPTPYIIAASETPTAMPTAAPLTPTALPPNPAALAPAQIMSGFWQGALVVGVLVLGIGALMRLRR
jgi:hypothetical protein